MKINRKKVQGFTLVELLISMVISLFLIGGVVTVYLSSKDTYNDRDALSLMEENARAALRSMTRYLEHTGYASQRFVPFGENFYRPGDAVFAGACQSGTNISGGTVTQINNTIANLQPTTDGGGNVSDTIGVKYLGGAADLNGVNLGAGLPDCSNTTLPAGCLVGRAANLRGSLIYSTFYVAAIPGGNQSALFCAGSRSTTPQQIADGVENLQILYGLDTNSDGTVDLFNNATEVAAAGRWAQVISLKIGILVRSSQWVHDIDTAQTYSVLGAQQLAFNDRFLRKVYITTIRLRNV